MTSVQYKTAIPILGLTFLLSACGTDLCPDKPTEDAIGYTSNAKIFNGSTKHGKVCTVSAHKLQEDESYRLREGLLYINGDLPNDVSLTVDSGKIVVNGNLGLNNSLKAKAPIKTHTERESYVCMQYNAALKMSTLSTCYKSVTIFDGYAYPNDHDPSIIINGRVNSSSKLTGNSGLYIRDYMKNQQINYYSDQYAKGARTKIDTGYLYEKGYHIYPLLNL